MTTMLSIEEIAADTGLWEAYGAAVHVDRYPGGCREPGHRCEICTAMLDEQPHKVSSRRVGRRPGWYLGTVEYRCSEPGCKADL